ncbi:MAG TPA: pyridoxamine 5'-phosphate oxidase [Gammaproteobacteria bacterium]|nr:pyridoxamine 5'-phosphate oxidase [Gammaproteobacteria bacterium]
MDISLQLQQLRREYQSTALDSKVMEKDPIKQCEMWLAQAIAAQLPDPTAMVLATVNAEGRPHTRVVLLKGISQQQFMFFTHYTSHKAHDIAQNPHVSLHFFWPLLERQMIIAGQAQRLGAADSDAYFNTRPRESQISTWASEQSQIIPSRAALLARQDAYREQFAGKEVPRPEDWGGYGVKPYAIEFWQGREQRLHDRLAYTLIDNVWEINRLAP